MRVTDKDVPLDRGRPSFDNRNTDGTYAAFDGVELVRAYGQEEPVTPLTRFVHEQFRALVLNPQFACVAARAAFNRGNYRFGVYNSDLGIRETTELLARDLGRFVREQDDTLREQGFSTFVACFTGPIISSEEQFERLLWRQLQGLHDLDTPHHPWDPTVSSDPEDPAFAFSFAERAFFIVGLHPGSSRLTRRFAFPTLVFNAHYQFEELREQGKYQRLQEVIRGRDRDLQGAINPNLSDFGENSDARQYSGRQVGSGWRCPFQAHPGIDLSLLDEDEVDREGRLR